MEEEYSDNSWTYLVLCGEPTLYEGLNFAKDLIIANIVLRLLIQNINLPHNVRHSISLIIGTFLLFNNVGTAFVWTIGLTISAYIAIVLISLVTNNRGLIVSIGVITFLLSCEIYSVNPKMWHQIRGIQMIAAMKIISVAIDLDRDLFKNMPNLMEFGGYVLCPANCILGPWISFHTYDQYLDVKFLTKRWLKFILLNLGLSMLYLVLSNCLVPWFLNDDEHKVLVAYRDAQAFRMSHYFVSSMSIVSMLSAGFGLSNDCYSNIEIAKPYHIELPRSLVQVVIYWNMPMHQWLKTYIFKTCQPYGHFIAILVTYAVSSLLHGLNFQLSAVLLSIGAISYVEYKTRASMASIWEMCCHANPCLKQCNHKYKKNSLITIFVNASFSVLTILHLAYLGVMFEASFAVQESGYSYNHILSRWSHLGYYSHTIAIVMYVGYLLVNL